MFIMDIKIGDSVCARFRHDSYLVGVIDQISEFHPRFHVSWNDGSNSWEDTHIGDYRQEYLDFLNK